MPDYSKSKIYKIYDNTNGDTYYGSTCNELRFRIQQHKNDAKNIDKRNASNCASIIINDDYDYSVVEEFPCETKLQLHTRERWYIENNKCINKIIPTRTMKEYREERKEVIKQTCKNYYDKNKDTIKLYSKKYKEEHFEYYKKYNETNRQINNEKQRQKIVCECGSIISKHFRGQHLKTPKHIKLMFCLPCPSPPSPP